MRDDQDEEPGLALQQAAEEFRLEEVSVEMEIEPPVSTSSFKGLEDSQHADKKLTREQLEALCLKLDTTTKSDKGCESDSESVISDPMESRCSKLITTELGLIEWAKVADLIEKAFEIINAS